MGFSKQSDDFILVRADSLFHEEKAFLHSVALTMLSIVLTLVSFSFVFEPYSVTPDVEKNSFALTDGSYIMLDTDGKYYLYVENKRMGIVTDPDAENFENIKFYNNRTEGIIR